MRICVVIPTYNNAGTLRQVVERTLQQGYPVIVVDDGSTDDTDAILRDLLVQSDDCKQTQMRVITHDRNRGKGAALKTGLRAARTQGYTHAITIDSDGQHYPEDIPLLVEAARRAPRAHIVGQRSFMQDNMAGSSRFANRFSNFWFAVETGRYLRDTQTGYRLYNLSGLPGLGLTTSRYEAELLLLVLAAWGGVPLRAADVRVYYPPRQQRVSHFRPVTDFARISVLNTLLCAGAVVYGYPSMLVRALWRGIKGNY